jgi:aldose 1-epimerase
LVSDDCTTDLLGEVASIENTPFDFRELTRIGDRIDESFDGYDMMFIIDGNGKRSFGKWVISKMKISFFYFLLVRVVDDKSGRAISVESTQKGLQFYTGNFLDDVKGHEGSVYNKHGALCLETQNYSDSVNNQVNII